jgi:hypothetical protein
MLIVIHDMHRTVSCLYQDFFSGKNLWPLPSFKCFHLHGEAIKNYKFLLIQLLMSDEYYLLSWSYKHNKQENALVREIHNCKLEIV